MIERVMYIQGYVVPSPRMHRRGRATGQQQRRYADWIQDYRKKLALAWTWGLVDEPEVEVSMILWRERKGGDDENLLKAVKDAMKGIIYEDDRIVKRSVVEILHGTGNPDLTQIWIRSYRSNARTNLELWKVKQEILGEMAKKNRPWISY